MLKQLKPENLEQYFLKLIKNRHPNNFEKFLLNTLFVASRFYRMAIQIRIWMYEKRLIRNRSIGCLVVSIGNVSCGGTGKTPVVEVFARSLTEQGRRVAILSRGYRSKSLTFTEKMMKLLNQITGVILIIFGLFIAFRVIFFPITL